MPQFLSWISKLGVGPDMDRLEVARVIMLNRLNFAGASVAVIVGVKDLISKGPEVTVLLFIFLFFVGELLLAYLKYHKAARFAANILLPLLMTTVLLLYGHSVGAGYTLFVFITTSIIFHEDWNTRIFLVIFIILLFLGSSLALLHYTPPLEERIDPFDSIITFIGTSVAVSLMITYFLNQNMKYEAEQAKLMASVQRSNSALQKANAELERFAYIASHDLKTPVRNISSFLGLAERDLKRGQYDKLGEFFEYARQGAHQMNTLIEDILDFSRLNNSNALKLEPVDLSTVVSNCTAQLRHSYGNRFSVITPDLPVIRSAESFINILFMNLLENAIKYNKSEQPTVEIALQNDPAEWLLSFSDNGIGIAPEFQQKIFLMFQRLHPPNEYKGTGIGLAMCKKVAHRLGGDIELYSQPGAGSRFVVRLPKDIPVAKQLSDSQLI